jgi:DNA-binding MarR family transcriptional regulator
MLRREIGSDRVEIWCLRHTNTVSAELRRYCCEVTDTQWLDDVEMGAWRGLLTAHSRLIAQLDTALQGSQGISLPDYEVLVHLSESEGGRLRMCELAESINLSPSGLTRRLDGLVKAGWVERIPCTEDRRGTYAVLLPDGRARVESAAPDHVEQVRRYFVDLLSRRQLAELAKALAPVGAGRGG